MTAALDRAAILRLNDAHADATSPLTAERLGALLDMAFHVGAVDGGRGGFLLGLDEGAAYDSPNFGWFAERYDRFAYVDRVVVAVPRQGVGRALYGGLEARARQEGHSWVCCEVNRVPPNPVSDQFHLALGFTEVGGATLPGGKAVRYLVKEL